MRRAMGEAARAARVAVLRAIQTHPHRAPDVAPVLLGHDVQIVNDAFRRIVQPAEPTPGA